MTCHAFYEQVILERDSSSQMESRSMPPQALANALCNVAQKVSICCSVVVPSISNQHNAYQV